MYTNISTNLEKSSLAKSVSVLIIGNNPRELKVVYDKLKGYRGIRFVADFCFSTKDSLLRILKNTPEVILVDDNIHTQDIQTLSEKINSNIKTRNIPIALLKSSYKNQQTIPGISDFLSKNGLSSRSLSKAILNLIRLKRTQRYLYINYKKNSRRVSKIFKK